MKIFCKSGGAQNNPPPNQFINKIGKYLNKSLSGAYKMKIGPNMCDVYTLVLYQLPRFQQIPGKGKEYNDVHEMKYVISISAYADKIRVSLIEISPNEKTLGFNTYTVDQMLNLKDGCELIYHNICKRLQKEYKDYNFLF